MFSQIFCFFFCNYARGIFFTLYWPIVSVNQQHWDKEFADMGKNYLVAIRYLWIVIYTIWLGFLILGIVGTTKATARNASDTAKANLNFLLG